jgi:hypothetical protein
VPAPAEALAEADRLAEDGNLLDAVDLLVAVDRAHRHPGVELALVDLRGRAAAAVDPGSGRSPWPPAYDDPFPEVSARLPEIGAADLTADVLGGAVAHHGALIVRGLFDADRVARAEAVLRRATAHRQACAAGAEPDEWYRPFPTTKKMDAVLRTMVADQGGTWLADSPAATARFLDDLAEVGAVDAIAEHLGERPFFSVQKSTLRLSKLVWNLVAWHQDGSFLDDGVRTMNVWLSLSHCGGDHPTPGMEVVPKRVPDVLPVDGILSPHSIAAQLVAEVAADAPLCRPEFAPGDAMLFDERFVHRTHLPEHMTYERLALECWFFAPSHPASGYLPLVV